VLHGACVFLGYLRDSRRAQSRLFFRNRLLSGFGQWMRQQRGTYESTLSNYSRRIREGLTQLGEEPSRWNAHSLRAFDLEKSSAFGWAAAKTCTTALRMFVRFG
jgi:hypothetical protein